MTFKKITLLALLLSSVISCIKQPEDDSVPTTPAEIQESLGNAWGETDPLSMKPGDFLSQQTEQRVDDYPDPIFTLDEGVTISKFDTTDTDYVYTYLYQTRASTKDELGKESTREDKVFIAKEADPEAIAMNAAREAMHGKLQTMSGDYKMIWGLQRLLSLAYACESPPNIAALCASELQAEDCKISCANLKSVERLEPAPAAIEAQPNCAGLKDCKLQTKKVSFDYTFSMKKDGGVQKQTINYSISVTPDLPFLGRMTQFCNRQLYPVSGGNKLLVTSCTALKNYRPAPP